MTRARVSFAAAAVAVISLASSARAEPARDRVAEHSSAADADEREGGSLGLGARTFLRAGATFGGGTRPRWVSPESSYEIRQYGLELRTSTDLRDGSSGRGHVPRSLLGTAFGFELQLGAFYSEESPVMRDRSPLPIEVVGSAGIAGRVLSLGSPRLLSLVFHLNPEISWGGQHWWSNTPRLGVYGGPRLLFRVGETAAELDYSFLPDYLTGSPVGMEVDRFEHRFSGALAYGRVAVGGRHVIAAERTRTPFPDILQSHASTTFLFLEIRNAR